MSPPRFRARTDVTAIVLDREAVVYCDDQLHLLDPVATLVWQCLDGEVTVDGLVAELATVFTAANGATNGTTNDAGSNDAGSNGAGSNGAGQPDDGGRGGADSCGPTCRLPWTCSPIAVYSSARQPRRVSPNPTPASSPTLPVRVPPVPSAPMGRVQHLPRRRKHRRHRDRRSARSTRRRKPGQRASSTCPMRLRTTR